jgi:glutathione S-transferase
MPHVAIKVVPQSQFCIKAVAALDHLHVKYALEKVNVLRLKSQLPPPHTVPSGKLPNSVILPESNDIIRHFDPAMTLFPPGALELDSHLATVFNAFVLYYNWIYRPTFQRSILQAVYDQAPPARLVPFLVRPAFTPMKRKMRRTIIMNLGIDTATIDNPHMMDTLFTAELNLLEARLAAQNCAGALYLCGPHVSIADFMFMGSSTHLMDHTFGLPPALPEALNSHPRLAELYARLRRQYPTLALDPSSSAYTPRTPPYTW